MLIFFGLSLFSWEIIFNIYKPAKRLKAPGKPLEKRNGFCGYRHKAIKRVPQD